VTTSTKIKIAEIRVPASRRRLDPAWVATIMADIQAGNGHMIPIEVVPEKADGYEYRLIFGGHRLAAVAGLGVAEIDAFVKDPKDVATETQIRKREIAENLIRRQLSVLDRRRTLPTGATSTTPSTARAKPGARRRERSPRMTN
jgi:ParB family chromosome partitioning protein